MGEKGDSNGGRRAQIAAVVWPIVVMLLGAFGTYQVLQYRVSALEAARVESESARVRDAAALVEVQRSLDRLIVDVGWIKGALGARPRAPDGL